MRKVLTTATVIMAAMIVPAVSAKKAPKAVWQVARTNDSITGATSCVVAAYDRVGGTSFSRVGALYPFVENSSVHGVLIGVSSGGRFRFPTGDIVWRVDDRPFRTLAAADNPAGVSVNATIPQNDSAMKTLVEQQMRLVTAATATSTVASDETARAMLAEMLAGKGLVFRPAAATASYGLPAGTERQVGQITRDGLRPHPLDDSFRAGLIACGAMPPIANSTGVGSALIRP